MDDSSVTPAAASTGGGSEQSTAEGQDSRLSSGSGSKQLQDTSSDSYSKATVATPSNNCFNACMQKDTRNTVVYPGFGQGVPSMLTTPALTCTTMCIMAVYVRHVV